MNDIEHLLAIEAIRQLKAKYFYGLDHRDWEMWRREVFAPDAALHVPEFRAEPFTPLDQLIDYVRESTADQVSVHHGHTPIIEVTSDTTATGIWVMEDRLYRSKEHPLYDGSTFLHGFGHYRETYVKLDCGWRIQTTQLTRLRVEMTKVF